MRAEPPADPNNRVRVFLGEQGERADHLAYIGHPYAAGVVYNQVTAAACIRVVRALLPGAGTTRISAPAPFGLPGGYPVVDEERSPSTYRPVRISTRSLRGNRRSPGATASIDRG